MIHLLGNVLNDRRSGLRTDARSDRYNILQGTGIPYDYIQVRHRHLYESRKLDTPLLDAILGLETR